MPEERLAIGVIGTGDMGGRHAGNLAHRVAGAEVVAVIDADQSRAAEVAANCGGATVFDDATALIRDPSVEAVVIASPDSTHADLAVACIEVGKPVLCEKPVGVTVEDAERVVRAEGNHGARLVQVGLMRQYDPRHAALKRMIDDGVIGRPVLFRGVHKNPKIAHVTSALDVIVNSAVHDIHSARWLMGDEVVSAYADYVPDLSDRREEIRLVLLQLRFENGGLATIEVDADSHTGYEVRVEVSGERGLVETPEAPMVAVLRQDGMASRAIEVRWLDRFEAAYRLEAEAWVKVAAAGSAEAASAWDGYAAMCIGHAAGRSLETKQAEPVEYVQRPAVYAAQ